ncbi:class I SAM-dependent methyltransferase [Azospirillum sp. RWY-5-1]|uniref:Class I SAM-dependent methyltransferase n=1 Tax=Azospirillum oleiclasticum TaxID=2735135 RepID=A0ABX2TCL1_9PROT|nr:class I SAM-dependent methyltransferase [Azospirillum oleiclasticum]NYZ22050.1 class I SAM-dependent methyltransferase [Azospirillum oleiclasticum]
MDPVQPFDDPAMVANYAQSTPRKVPGFADLHRMAVLLLAERAPETATILVVGAGGGLELTAFAGAQAGWRFVGVDPSAAMLDLARRVLGPLQARVALLRGHVDDAPPGPFDGATCLLTLHFLTKDERLRTLREIHRRLRPQAPLIVAHHSHPTGSEPIRWLARSAAFAGEATTNSAQAAAAAASMAERLPILSVEEDEAVLRQAGFSEVALFYAALSFRGWVAAA